MALSDRAALAVPYAQQLLFDKEVQAALRQAASATRDAYARGRGKSARQAAKDKRLRRKVQQALAAVGELWSAIGAPKPRRKPRRRRQLATLVVSGAGVFLAANPQARTKLLERLGKSEAKNTNPSQ